jgi:hypothetical protein
MTQEEMQTEFDKNKNLFDTVKKQTEDNIERRETYRGLFYEIFPFSYQRAGFKQGTPIENINRIRSTNGLFTYGFDDKNRIIEVKEGISIKDQFYCQFLFYEKNYIKSLNYDNSKILQNISFCFLDRNGNVTVMYSKGRRGGREESYQYNQYGTLDKIIIKQFDKNGNEGDTLQHSFEYNFDGSLKSITKSAVNKDFSEVIY